MARHKGVWSAAAAVALIGLWGGAAQAADLGARAMGMGGAYVALANDATAVYWNPAGLTEVSHVSFTPVLAVDMAGIEEARQFYDAMQKNELPTKGFSTEVNAHGMAGVVFKRFGLTYFRHAKVDIVSQAPDPNDPSTFTMKANGTDYAETALTGTLPLAKLPFKLGAASLGANVKFLQGKYFDIVQDRDTGETTTTLKATGNGYALDLGAQAKLTEWLRMGVVARDLVRRVDWTGDTKPVEDTAPTLAAGVAAKAPLGFTVAADVERTKLDGKDFTRFRAGLESSIFGILTTQAGVKTNPDGQPPTYSLGAGLGLFKYVRLEGAVASDLHDSLESSLTGIIQF